MQITKSVNELIDEAVEELPFIRRRMTKRWLARGDNHAELSDSVMLKLCDCEEVKAMGLSQGFASGAIAADTPIGFDPENLRKFLDLIIEYLPKILQIIMPLFLSVVPILLAFAAGSFATTAVAEPVKPMPCFAPDPATLAGDIETKQQVLAVVKERSVLSQFLQQADCQNGQCPVPVKAPVLKRVKSILEVATPASKRGPVRKIAYSLRQPMKKTGRFVAKVVAFFRPRNVAARMRSRRGC